MPVIIPIHDLALPELDAYARLNEPQLKHYYEPEDGLFLAETPTVIERALLAGYTPVSFLTEEKFIPFVLGLLERTGCAAASLPLYTAPLDVLVKLTGYNLTRGILGLMRRLPLPSMADICRDARRIAVLENVDNPTNIGAIFRSAAALGMDAVLLTADCCDPLYRRSIRVSVGTVFQIPWTYLPAGHTQVLRYVDREAGIYRKEDALYSPYWPVTGLKELKQMGFVTVSLALTERAVPIDDPSIPADHRLAVILGNEGSGLCEQTISESDHTAIIPMTNGVDSLNVAAASAVAFWQLGKRSR